MFQRLAEKRILKALENAYKIIGHTKSPERVGDALGVDLFDVYQKLEQIIFNIKHKEDR